MPTAALEVLTTRRQPMIDPTLHIWGWEITVYLFLGGIAAGLLILAAVTTMSSEARARAPSSPARQWMPLLGLGLLSVGMGGLFLDLEYKLHFYRFYLAVRPSAPMWWGAWVLLLVYPVGLLQTVSGLDADRRAQLMTWPVFRQARVHRTLTRLFAWVDGARQPIAWLALAAGVALGIYTGVLLSTLSARAPWNSHLLGPIFLTSGLSTAIALTLLFPLMTEERHRLVRWDMWAVAGELVLLALFVVGLAAGDGASRAAAEMVLGGSYTAPFWGLVVSLGLVTPLILEFVAMRRDLPFTRTVPALLLIGGLALRAVLLAAGQSYVPGA